MIEAAAAVMVENGVDTATMQEIAERADVGVGTVYNYFESKDALAICVLETLMERLAQQIRVVTDTFEDRGQVYAFGVRTVMQQAITDRRWRGLLWRSEVMADAMYRTMGPYAMTDLREGVEAKRYEVEDVSLAWRLATHAIVGFGLAVCEHRMLADRIDEAVVNLLCMVGVSRQEAWEIAQRPTPSLPSETSEYVAESR